MSTQAKNLPQSKLLPLLPSSLQFFSVAEVSIILGTSTKLVHDWINKGLLPSFRLGEKNRLIRIRQADLEKFIDAHIRNGSVSLKEDAPIPADGES